jgi:hypothetical protein
MLLTTDTQLASHACTRRQTKRYIPLCRRVPSSDVASRTSRTPLLLSMVHLCMLGMSRHRLRGSRQPLAQLLYVTGAGPPSAQQNAGRQITFSARGSPPEPSKQSRRPRCTVSNSACGIHLGMKDSPGWSTARRGGQLLNHQKNRLIKEARPELQKLRRQPQAPILSALT